MTLNIRILYVFKTFCCQHYVLECTREELYQKCVAAHELYMKSIKSNGDQSGWSKDEHEKFHKGKTVLPELSIYSSNVYTGL